VGGPRRSDGAWLLRAAHHVVSGGGVCAVVAARGGPRPVGRAGAGLVSDRGRDSDPLPAHFRGERAGPDPAKPVDRAPAFLSLGTGVLDHERGNLAELESGLAAGHGVAAGRGISAGVLPAGGGMELEVASPVPGGSRSGDRDGAAGGPLPPCLAVPVARFPRDGNGRPEKSVATGTRALVSRRRGSASRGSNAATGPPGPVADLGRGGEPFWRGGSGATPDRHAGAGGRRPCGAAG
jgi:hypothetical protein